MTNPKHTQEEYLKIVERIKSGTATEQEIKDIEELVLNATIEINNILEEENN
ncbi:MAG: hypothetical protein KBD26_02015 [Candidatus Pacebacteria bacterium]|nr:hypothetical protein [Candidatus Paceibacterota bacterium]